MRTGPHWPRNHHRQLPDCLIAPNHGAELAALLWYVKEVQAAARSLGQQIRIVEASSESEIDTAFATFAAA